MRNAGATDLLTGPDATVSRAARPSPAASRHSAGAGKRLPYRTGTVVPFTTRLLSLARRRACIEHVLQKFDVSQRFACRVLGQHRSSRAARCRAAITPCGAPFPTSYGPEFVAKPVRYRICAVGAKAAYIGPGSPGENGYCESFDAKLRDGLVDGLGDGASFCTLAEAKIVIESWRRHGSTRRPHSSLGFRTPAPAVVQWTAPPSGAALPATPTVAPRPLMHQD